MFFKPSDTNFDNKKYQVVKTEIDTFYKDTGYVRYKPGKKIVIETTIEVPVPTKVDTQAILKDFYTKRIYVDTFNFVDSLGRIVIKDTISENKIASREYDVKIREKIIKETITVKEKPKNQWYLGGSANLNSVNLIGSVGSSILLKNKKDKIYILGLGVSPSTKSTIIPTLQGGIYYRILK
jgi:hypothetical protein